MLFLASFGIFGLSSHTYNSLLWYIYGNVDHPSATQLYLSSIRWYWAPPGLAALVLWFLWRKTNFEKTGPYAVVAMYFVSVITLVFMFYAAVLPLFTTTWRINS